MTAAVYASSNTFFKVIHQIKVNHFKNKIKKENKEFDKAINALWNSLNNSIPSEWKNKEEIILPTDYHQTERTIKQLIDDTFILFDDTKARVQQLELLTLAINADLSDQQISLLNTNEISFYLKRKIYREMVCDYVRKDHDTVDKWYYFTK